MSAVAPSCGGLSVRFAPGTDHLQRRTHDRNSWDCKSPTNLAFITVISDNLCAACMASTPLTLGATTPTHLHPLSPQDSPSSRGRRSHRKTEESLHADDSRPDYFTLKSQMETTAEEQTWSSPTSWDGSVRGYGKGGKQRSVFGRVFEQFRVLNIGCDRAAKAPPLILVEPASTDRVSALAASYDADDLSEMIPNSLRPEIGSISVSEVLATNWHEYSDDAIQSAISKLSMSESPAHILPHPYDTVIRVLSAAMHKLARIHRELEESRRILLEKEAARKSRADQLMRELQPTDKGLARRVLQSLFPNDDEADHMVQRKHSYAVR